MCGIDHEGHIDRNFTFQSKAELVDCLRRWLVQSTAPTIGDVGSFGGKPWLPGIIDGHSLHINADKFRPGVERFLSDHDRSPEADWKVIPNRNGTRNKLVGPSAKPIRGWYAYLDDALDPTTGD